MPSGISGVGGVVAKIKQAAYRTRLGSAQGINLLAEEIMTDSKQNYVPVEDGILRDSGYVQHATPENLQAELGFGGAAKDYAVVQHEITSFHHKVGEAKYLEKPLVAQVNKAGRKIATSIEKNLT